MLIGPSDVHGLSAADGWLDLGDWKSAVEELDRLRPELRAHPIGLSVYFRAYAAGKKWEAAFSAAEATLRTNPDDYQAWIHRSFALHELKRTREAEEFLLPALDKFPEESTVPYNLACYACVLGDLPKARALLERAAAVGDARELERMASEDPDLEALRNEKEKP